MSCLSPALLAALVQPAAAQEVPAPVPAPEPAPEPAPPPEPASDAESIRREAEAAASASFYAQAPAQAPASANVFNPRITAFGDALWDVAVEDEAVVGGSGPWVRSLELDLRADVDPFAKAVAVLALEREPPLDEPGAGYEASPEEVYIDLVALPAGLSARAGAFRQPFGIANKAHPHDLPWPDLPPALGAILGEEGWIDTGVVAAWRIPNPWQKGFTIEGGAVAGAPFDPEETVATPAWLARAEYFDDLGAIDFGIGATAGGIADDRREGADLMVRWRKDQWRSVVLVAEAVRSPDGLGTTVFVPSGDGVDAARTTEDATGGYACVQIQPRRPLFVGVRADWLDPAIAWGGFVSYYTSEFLRIRAGARWEPEAFSTRRAFLESAAESPGLPAVPEQAARLTATAQLTFVWGSHPVEPYWVNR